MRQTHYFDGCKYIYEVFRNGSDITEVVVYDGNDPDQELVNVMFNHDVESASVKGVTFDESAPYFELKDQEPTEIVGWAVVQWEALS